MSDQRIILVSPLAHGWAVSCAGIEPLIFRSGGRAEAQARQLAQVLARLGREVHVRILDRGRNLIGTLRFPAL
ncbi:hypothetical protein [Phenylobacterium sp.]|jgi:hypothetical protein|uniref:hypothetical protein n=1 Tax=Phenylobacterium sp. TaxID=1871053 RepID=UPI0037C6A8A0